MTILDISPRVLAHVDQATRAGKGYVVYLPRHPAWGPALSAFWASFGNQVGTPVAGLRAPAGLEMRSIEVRPEALARVRAADLDVVAARLALEESDRFDVVVATNVLVYYGDLEQSLALLNVAAMLRPGGLLVSNNSLPLGEGVPLAAAGYRTVVYSDRPDDGDHLVWYRLSRKSGN